MKIAPSETAAPYLPQPLMYFLCLLFTKAVFATPPAIGDFSEAGLLTDGSESIRKVELPYAALTLSEQSGLRDIQVFDANDQPVPGKIIHLSSTNETLDTQSELTFFPFGSDTDSETIRYTFEVDQKPEHTNFSLRSNGTIAGTNLTKTNYIVHIPKETLKNLGKLNAMKLDWEDPRQNLIVPIKIEASSDLKHWKTLEEGAAVSHLSHGDLLLKKNEITFKPTTESYLRLSWPDSISQFYLTRITGGFTKSRRTPIEIRYQNITCSPADTVNSCEFEIAPYLSINAAKLLSDEPEYFLQARVFSRQSSSEPWKKRQVVQAYRLSVDGQEVTNPTIAMPASTARFWKLEFEEPVAMDRDQFPRLEIEWSSIYQVFLARGSEPFRLAVGSGLASSTGSEIVTDIMRQAGTPIAEVEQVFLNPLNPIEVDRAFWTRKRIETYLLWSVLIIGVALMFRIALGLFRKLDTHPND